jgi:hypothetical protein
MQTQLKHANYVVEQLESSTNERTKEQREQCVSSLKMARSIAVMTPGELPELAEGVTRYRFTRAQLDHEFSDPVRLKHWWDTEWTLSLGMDGLYAIDVKEQQ